MRILRNSVLTLLLLAGAWAAPRAQPAGGRVIGYFTSWSIYGRDYHVADIPADAIGCVNYAFAKIEDGLIALGDPYADVDRWYPGDSWHPDSLRGCFNQLRILKRAHPHLKTLVSVGGWTWSTYFSDVALTPESRSLFAASCVEFIRAYGFDGVDIDWEYPVSGGHPANIYRPEDRENCTLLLQELRAQLDAAGNYLLTIAAPAGPAVIANYEVDAIHQHLDWINVMTYDFHGPWGGEGDAVTHFHSPLFPAGDDPLGEPFRSQFNLAAAMQTYRDLGVPAPKLHAGLAFYGRGYGGVSGGANGLYASYAGPSAGGTWEPGVYDYWDLAANVIGAAGYSVFRHPDARVPWLHSAPEAVFISYDDPESIAEKCSWVMQQDLGGIMFWELSADRDADLLGAALAAMQEAAAIGDRDSAGPGADAGRRQRDPRPDAVGRETLTDVEWAPNPGGPDPVCRFRLLRPGDVRVTIYDAQGRRLWAAQRQGLAAGVHELAWNGRGDQGRPCPPGAYFWSLASGPGEVRGRLLRVRPGGSSSVFR